MKSIALFAAFCTRRQTLPCHARRRRSGATGLTSSSTGDSKMTRALALIAALMFSTAVHAHETTVGTLQIIHAHIPLPAKGAMAAGGFMEIVNTGTETERLIGLEVDFATAHLHQTVVDAAGVAAMNPVEAIEIPPGASVALEHGGYHVMLMGLNRTLAVGDMLPGVLIFEHQGRVEIEFMVDPRDGSMDHGRMDMNATVPGN